MNATVSRPLSAMAQPFTPAAEALPEPQPLLRETPPSAPYPAQHLGPLQPAVAAVVGMAQTPVAMTAGSALAVASLAVQGFANVESLGGARPLSLYLLTLARSGERKSASDEGFMAALRKHEQEQVKAQREAWQAWQNAHTLWKGERERILAEAKKGRGEKRVAAQADLDALKEPAAPPSEDRTVSEPTFEGLTKLFAIGQPSLGLFSDEGGQFLGGHAMNSENRLKTMAALNDLWQGNPIRRTRAGDGHHVLYGRRLAVHLMVQPGIARGFLADPLAASSGFLARCLICEPGSTIGTRFHENARDGSEALAGFAARLRAILERPMPMDPETRELQPRLLPLTPDARQLLIGYYDFTEREQAPGGDLERITATASKTAEQACRIAGVLALWRDLDAAAVTAQDMACGIGLAQHYLTEALRLATAAQIPPEIERAELLRQWLVEKWSEPDVTSGEVVQRGPNALREGKAVHAAMAVLEKAGWVIPLSSGVMVRGKPRKHAWKIVRGSGDVV